ncbi:DUF6011 domain-containing protein [Streptomyces sp. NPDC051320]|uniref:DUF6011 domain-containing protein n=1 Tax=Streptomyces sp. NPDC051320 TaxID=3154644 RepID=UPI00342DD6FC
MQLLMDQFAAEEWPDGTFGGARTVRGVRSAPIKAHLDPNAAAHVAELSAALGLPLYLRRKAQAMTTLPDGHYAVLDPSNPDAMTYWRSKNGRLIAWPAKAWHGPARPLRRDAPVDHAERIAWMRAWHESYRVWLQTLHMALQTDPGSARRRFADLTVRCCQCGRPLRDDTSKVIGIGPDCRGGLSPEALAALFMPPVAAAHAASLSQP